MPIKDKNYWKEYNAKRKAYIQQKNKERYLNDSQQGKGSINTTDKDTTQNNTTTDTTFNTTPPINTTELKKDTTEQIQPINTTPEKIIQPIQPKAELIQPKNELCFHCHQYPVPDRGEAYCLVCSEWLKERQAWKERVFKRDKIIKELERSQQELLKPINPTIERWKNDYLTLQKKTNQQLSEQSETINRLKEKLREKDREKQEREQKYSKLENSNQNISKSPIKDISKTENIIPVLLDREKKKIILYSCPDPCYQGKFCSNCSAPSQLV